jgi:DNA-binding MarR family transcriptional regulator
MLEGVLRDAGLEEHVRPGTGHILFALFEQDNRTIKELVDRAGLSYSTLSGMVSQLRRAKLVSCRRDLSDGRSVRVRLTPLGRSLESKCQGALARVDEIMLSGISESRLRTTRNALTQMTDAMREHENGRRVARRKAGHRGTAERRI